MSKILIGTSGYSYPEWRKVFYPENLAETKFLQFYAQHFNFVELNFSYYTIANPNLLKNLIAKTSSNFFFALKAHKSLTHERKSLEDQALVFKKAINPLSEENRLVAILFQFPYSFHYNKENRIYLAKLLEIFSNLPIAIEFRNSEWVKETVIATLERRQVAFVNVDQPPLEGLLKLSTWVTAKLAYLRLHGRNKANWWKGTTVSRYDYLYSDDELIEFLDPIQDLLKKAQLLLIAFNNHARGQAVSNAWRLHELLKAHNLISA